MTTWREFDLGTDEGRRQLNRYVAEQSGFQIYHYDKDYAERCYYMLMTPDFDTVVSAYPYSNFTPTQEWGMRAGERKTEAEAWADCPQWTEHLELALHLAGDAFVALRKAVDADGFTVGFFGDVGRLTYHATELSHDPAVAIVLACCAWDDKTREAS